MLRTFCFLVGFGFTIIGSIYVISYLNLLAFGYKFYEYVNFIIGRIECLYLVIGIILILLSIMLPGGKKDELYI